MRGVMYLVLVCSLCAVGGAAARGSIGAIAPDLRSLCQGADLIVVGQAASVHPDGLTTVVDSGATYPGRIMVVDINVEKILKGTQANRTVTFSFSVPTVPVVSVGGVGVSSGQFGVFFLRRIRDGYEVIDPDFPFVIAAPGAPEKTGDTIDQVVAEVAHVLDAPESPDRLKEQAISILASSRTFVATAALRAAACIQPVNVRLAAMGVLLAGDDISVLPEAQRLLLSNDPIIQPSSKDQVASAIGYGVRDSRAIPYLIPLLRSADVLVRRGAASALRNIRNAAAIKPLAQALYDEDRKVQYYAVIGLAEITSTEGEWAPATNTFLNDPKSYLDHWREWAKSQK